MGIFHPLCDVERKGFIFLEYNTNTLIDGKIIYVLGDNYKQNII